ncbi:hypothetical protein K8R43_05625, partial [archaeon]|nr:hypothetical protein [archaeon]
KEAGKTWKEKLRKEEHLKVSKKVAILIRTDPELKHFLGQPKLKEFFEEQGGKNAKKRHFMERAELAAYIGTGLAAEVGGESVGEMGVAILRLLRVGEEATMPVQAISRMVTHLSAHPSEKLTEEELGTIMKKRERKKLKTALLEWEEKRFKLTGTSSFLLKG